VQTFKPSILGISSLLFALGCESVALMPRPTIDRPSDLPPASTARTDPLPIPPPATRDRDLARGDTSATVERVDDARQELYLRSGNGRIIVMRYDPRTVVLSEGQELSPSALRDGDLVRVQSTRSSAGEEYADVIRIERLETGSIHY
jgi:hypothetical protein